MSNKPPVPKITRLRPTSPAPQVAFARPKSDEEYRVYIGGDIKVRKMNSGVIQIATEHSDWMEV